MNQSVGLENIFNKIRSNRPLLKGELIYKNIGAFEQRQIYTFRINSTLLKTMFNMEVSRHKKRKISFNLMMITNDHKVLLLQRSQSFHFSKICKDLKFNRFDFNLLRSLYNSELEQIREMFFDFMPSLTSSSQWLFPSTPPIYIFPGGHSDRNESILLTLLREFKEETSININFKNLRFNQNFIFKVLIHDLMIKETFDNIVFPVKVDMSSNDISRLFKETRHTKNPTFVDIREYESLFDIFIHVQNFMTL